MGGAGGAGGSTSTGGGAGGAGGMPIACTPACGAGLTCCNGVCVNPANDIHNCGACGVACNGPAPFCDGHQCKQAACDPEVTCDPGGTCCGSACCGDGQLCCVVNQGGPKGGPMCVDPVNGTCPLGN